MIDDDDDAITIQYSIKPIILHPFWLWAIEKQQVMNMAKQQQQQQSL